LPRSQLGPQRAAAKSLHKPFAPIPEPHLHQRLWFAWLTNLRRLGWILRLIRFGSLSNGQRIIPYQVAPSLPLALRSNSLVDWIAPQDIREQLFPAAGVII